jgi:Predicted transcriptional regulators
VRNDTVQRLMERVKLLRKSLGMTQEAFAERAGLKYKHYQAVEAGHKPNIQFETVIKMARACGIEPWQLLHFDEPVEALAEAQQSYDTNKGSAVAKQPAAAPTKKSTPKRRR